MSQSPIDHYLFQKTEELCKSILAIQDTFFGEFWVFSNESKDNEVRLWETLILVKGYTFQGEEYHEDTAYGNEEIGPHVDGTYFQNGLGIQALISNNLNGNSFLGIPLLASCEQRW